MTTESNGHIRFKVVLIGTVKADLRRFHQELMQHGKGNQFLQALRSLNDRLSKDPRTFGETLYRLPALKIMVYQGIINPLVVTFGVHEELAIVFVHVVKILSTPE